MITRIEELSLNAWPAFQTQLLDGWVVRFAAGYTRRANSVLALYPGPEALDQKIDWCEEIYRRNGLPVVFKLTTASQPAGLDERLAERGYRAEAETIVQLLDLADWTGPEHCASDLGGDPDEAWQTAFARMSGIQPQNQATHARILAAIQPECCYAALRTNAGIVACGLGVLQAGFLGLFDIVVDPKFRRKGYGEQVVRDLLAWGQNNGAQSTYLQVMLNNPAALSLYFKVGYRPAYTYWYRVKN